MDLYVLAKAQRTYRQIDREMKKRQTRGDITFHIIRFIAPHYINYSVYVEHFGVSNVCVCMVHAVSCIYDKTKADNERETPQNTLKMNIFQL